MPPPNTAHCWSTPSWAHRTSTPGAVRLSSRAAHADSHPTYIAVQKRPAGTSWPTLRSTQVRAHARERPMPTQRRIPMTLTGNRRAASSIAAKEVSPNGTPHSPWPAILETLPDYEPDTLLLSLEFYLDPAFLPLLHAHPPPPLSLSPIPQ